MPVPCTMRTLGSPAMKAWSRKRETSSCAPSAVRPITLISDDMAPGSLAVWMVTPPRRRAASSGVTATTGVTSAMSLSATRIFMVPAETSKFWLSITRSTRASRPRLFNFTRSPALMFLGRCGCAFGSRLSAPVVCTTTVELNCSENSRRARAMRVAESRWIFCASVLSPMPLTISRSWYSTSSISDLSFASNSRVRAFCSARPSSSSAMRARANSFSRACSASRSAAIAPSCAWSWSSNWPMSAACVVSCARAAATMAGALHGLTVIREAERADLAQLGHLRQLLSLQPARDRSQKTNRNARFARRRVTQRAQQRGRAQHRIGVRHRDPRAEPAGGGGAGACFQVLLVLLPGRAQMDVRVEERRQQCAPARLDRFLIPVLLERAWRPQLGDLAIAHTHVTPGVDALAGVEDVCLFEQEARGDARSLDERSFGHHASCGSGAGWGSRAPASNS